MGTRVFFLACGGILRPNVETRAAKSSRSHMFSWTTWECLLVTSGLDWKKTLCKFVWLVMLSYSILICVASNLVTLNSHFLVMDSNYLSKKIISALIFSSSNKRETLGTLIWYICLASLPASRFTFASSQFWCCRVQRQWFSKPSFTDGSFWNSANLKS